MKKILSVTLCVLMVAGLLSGCGASPAPAAEPAVEEPAPEAEEPAPEAEAPAAPSGTIKVGNWDTATMNYMQPLLDAFHAAYPDITVEIVDTPSADYTTKLSVQLNGGSDVDAFWIKDGDTTKGLADKGQLADLTEFITRDGIDLAGFSGLAERFAFDGKNVALPARADYYVLYYNKDIFDAAGVPYPTNDMTWTEWEELCAQLTSGEGAEKKYGGHFHTWQACIQNWGVQDGQYTIMETDYSFFKPYYEMALRMQEAGTVMDFATLKTGNIHYSSAFLSGNVATLPMGTFFMTTIIQSIQNGESNVNWGIATLPHPDGVPAGWTVGSVTPIAINEASPNKEAAWEFIKFVTGPEGAKIYADGFALPGLSSDDILQSITSAEGMPEGALEALKVVNVSLDRPSMDKVAEVNQMLGEQHSLLMLGEVSVDDGLAEMGRLSAEIQEQ